MKSKTFMLLFVLIAWMGGSEYVWLCLVKNHCEKTSAPFSTGQTSPQPPVGPAQSEQTDNPPPAVTVAPGPQRVAESDRPAQSADFAPANVPVEPKPIELPTPQALPEAAPIGAPVKATPVQLRMDGAVVLEFEQPLQFGASAWQLSENSALPDRLAGWMKTNPHADLTVIGEYRSNETNRSDWSNLGLARANELIDRLVEMGIVASRLTAQSEQVSAGAGLRLEGTDYSLLFTPIQIYFPLNSTALSVTPELRRFGTLARDYLNRHPAAMVRVVGHTDEAGGLQNNYSLGLSRAREVAGLLRSLGVSPARMETDSAGESQPIAGNDRIENRALNRRVELTLTSR